MDNKNGIIEIVPPASVGRETLYVLITIIAIICCSSLVIFSHHRPDPVKSEFLSHQLDLTQDLNHHEQGIYTDLKTVFDEWVSFHSNPFVIITPQQWAEDGWPPFINDSTNIQRGAYQWQLVNQSGYYAYLGHSTTQPTAAKVMWRLPHPLLLEDDFEFDIWLHHQDGNVPEQLYDEELIAAGWKQVSSIFTSGVTR